MREIQVVAAAIIDEDGRVLAAQRGPGMSHAGLWELPGGKIEPGESPEAALAREIREELGLAVAVGAHLDTNRHAYPHIVVHLAAYRCTLVGGSMVLAEHSAVRWLAAGQLGAVTWAAADVPLLEAVRAACLTTGSGRS